MHKEREISSEDDYLMRRLRTAFLRGWTSVSESVNKCHGAYCNIMMGISRGKEEVKRVAALQTVALAMLDQGLTLEEGSAILTNHCLYVPLYHMCEDIAAEHIALRQAREQHYTGLGNTCELCGAFEGMIQEARQEVIETVKTNIEVWRDHHG